MKSEKYVIGLIVAIVILTLVALLSGCYQDATGGWRLGLNEADQIEKGLDTTAEGLGLISLLVPGATGLAAAAAGVAGAFKKLKPELTKQKKTTDHIVTTIERIKGDYPELWATISGRFKDGTDADIEEVIERTIALHKTIKGGTNAV